ncbi:hypothetical protein EYZ11_009774 [Aspergillus tanneri]|uniref:Uncharacterized protein n=1 Tax=Aspergillus tanneri TaxID=1220188 RepID=A0A4V3UND6_9EURO|nr:hypothetical protein EYZ11_009774 [Aspergillus tanneri]
MPISRVTRSYKAGKYLAGFTTGDGLLKRALETVFHRWSSEGWADYLSICGAVIGWTRSTSLMNHNDLVAEGIERHSVRTFSTEEMAHGLLGLMAGSMLEFCHDEPFMRIWAGGRPKSLALESCLEADGAGIPIAEGSPLTAKWMPHVWLDFPRELSHQSEIASFSPQMDGMVDLDRVVVVTGFGEVGPWGSSRARWEMEAYGGLSHQGCIEMAWMMGLVRYTEQTTGDGQSFSGWVDARTGELVADVAIKEVYEERILAQSGIRLIEPEVCDGYSPEKKPFLHELIAQEDLGPLVVTESEARQIQLELGDKADIREPPTSGGEG